MTDRERQELMPERVRELAESIYSRSKPITRANREDDYIAFADEAIRAAKTFDREWRRQCDEADRLPVEPEPDEEAVA